MKFISEVVLPKVKKSKYISGQGTTCEIDNRGYYYVGLSYAGEKDILEKSSPRERGRVKKELNRKLKKYSHVDVYRIDTSLGINEPRGYYMGRLTLKAKNSHISWKSQAKRQKARRLNHCVKFEIEDMYIYKKSKRMYFNSEGGGDCKDMLGSMRI